MGTVYGGFDLHGRRRVAIKILSPDHCRKAKSVARFEREASLLATLRHPNIVQILATGRRGALPYIVMELLEGRTLLDELTAIGGKLPPTEVLPIVRQVCSGLSFFHHNGLVHRDIKPQNLFLGPDGHLTILDLGVVRDKSAPSLTKPGAMVGTPYYMAPELITGTQEIDHRADLYALGALVFELFCGRPPFLGANNFEVLRMHRTEPVPNASELSPFVPKQVSAILSKALAKAPEDRHQSAQEFLADLESAYCLDAERTNPGVSLEQLEKAHRAIKRKPSRELQAVAAPSPRAPPAPTTQTEDGSAPGTTVTETGELRVVTTVDRITSAADLYVDGQRHGTTPASLSLPAGRHRVRLERSGFRLVEQDTHVQPNQVTLFRVELERG